MIINFSMDFLALYITAKIMHIKIKQKRLTIGALLGALYSVAILTVNLNGFLSGIISVIASALMTFTAYGKQKTGIFLKNTTVFYIVSFALGGGITAICNMLNMWQNKREIMINGTFDVLYGDLPFGLLALLTAICGLLSVISGKIIKKNVSVKTCTVKIIINRSEVELTALADSGNLLKEPISGKPVIIAAFDSLRQIIPVELLSLFKTKDLKNLTSSAVSSRVRIIPTSTINSRGLLFALSPDMVTVDGKEVDTYVAITPENSNFSGFSAVVPVEIIQ